MDRPENLSPEEVRLWDSVVEQLAERPDFDDLWAAAIERYVRATELARTAWKKVPKSLTAKGSMQQTIAHPMIAVAQKAEELSAKYGAALGVEPVAEKRSTGRPKGSVSAPDRVGAPPKITKLKAV